MVVYTPMVHEEKEDEEVMKILEFIQRKLVHRAKRRESYKVILKFQKPYKTVIQRTLKCNMLKEEEDHPFISKEDNRNPEVHIKKHNLKLQNTFS